MKMAKQSSKSRAERGEELIFFRFNFYSCFFPRPTLKINGNLNEIGDENKQAAPFSKSTVERLGGGSKSEEKYYYESKSREAREWKWIKENKRNTQQRASLIYKVTNCYWICFRWGWSLEQDEAAASGKNFLFCFRFLWIVFVSSAQCPLSLESLIWWVLFQKRRHLEGNKWWGSILT